MSIYRLDIDNAALQQAGQMQVAPTTLARDGSVAPGTAEATPADRVILSERAGTAYDELQLKTDRQNQVAGAIRKTDRAAELLGQKIDALKAPLETIV